MLKLSILLILSIFSSSVLGGIWTRLAPTSAPYPPKSHGGVLFAFEQGYVIFGGRTPNGKMLNITMLFDMKQYTWRQLPVDPPYERYYMASCKSNYHKEEAYFIHGGFQNMRDLWVFKKEYNGQFSWKYISSGPYLFRHQMVNYEDAIFLYGGYDSQGMSDALWVYNITLDSWERILPSSPWPGTITDPSMRVNGGKIVLLGTRGRDKQTIYVLDPYSKSFRKLPVNSLGSNVNRGTMQEDPKNTDSFFYLDYDPNYNSNRLMVLKIQNDTRGVWSYATTPNFYGRQETATASSQRGYAVFGGRGNSYYDDLWLYVY